MNSSCSQCNQFAQHAKQHQHWIRLIYMLIIGVLLNIAGAVMWVLCTLQFLFVLGSGRDNRHMRRLTLTITRFMEQALLYVNYNSEQRPFPFAPWPHVPDEDARQPADTAADTDADKALPDNSDRQ